MLNASTQLIVRLIKGRNMIKDRCPGLQKCCFGGLGCTQTSAFLIMPPLSPSKWPYWAWFPRALQIPALTSQSGANKYYAPNVPYWKHSQAFEAPSPECSPTQKKSLWKISFCFLNAFLDFPSFLPYIACLPSK